MTSNRPAADLREAIRAHYLPDEAEAVHYLAQQAGLSSEARKAISAEAAQLVRDLRARGSHGTMESFLNEYGLSTKEGVALMCLAEALLRVPDAETIDELIQDKIAPADWAQHLGHSSSSLVNASTWALLLTGHVLSEGEEAGLVRSLRGMVKRLGEPVVRTAVGQAMRQMGQQFVLGRDIEEAMERASKMEAKGYSYSYDMLGEAARTEADARRYHLAYSDAIAAIAKACKGEVRDNPGISVKLSALYARYEMGQKQAVQDKLAPRVLSLATLAQSANMGFNIDAEEADRLDLSLDIIEEVLSDPALEGWDGFGVVVQAYGPRAWYVLDWLYDLAARLDRRIMVRLVKGAYWDTEIKRAQVMGLEGFPVFTRKTNTDVSYLACAKKLLSMTDRIYPQFATHNAHTAAAILEMGGDQVGAFEFQRLHGMGEGLHELVMKKAGSRCRIYAPVGAHRDLLAYLVRRLLENGANSSFVNQIVDERVAPEVIAEDPIAKLESLGGQVANPYITRPADIYGKDRKGAKGWDITDVATLRELETARGPFLTHKWEGVPLLAASGVEQGAVREVRNPARPDELVGTIRDASPAEVDAALDAGLKAQPAWEALGADKRGAILERVADLYEDYAPELFALATREAGKIQLDCVAEVREAVDFLRFYANEARRLEREEPGAARGLFACVSPWNFPLAIFTGQIAAALAAGNAVVAKPAEQTSLMGWRAAQIMLEAGVPEGVIQLLPGDGAAVGAPLVSDPRVSGVCFTGSTETAQRIHKGLAATGQPDAPLIAETGGLNAMIVDSTALPEQAVRDIVASAFQSAGQRCSALRVLYLQKDVEKPVMEMLKGAMELLRQGDPWAWSTDVGPVIDQEAREGILAHCEKMEAEGRLVAKLKPPKGEGCFVPPAIYKLAGIDELEREIFGPILHVCTFEAEQLEQVVDSVNATGYGLTFGLHTRIEERVQRVVEDLKVGNVYVNRNQIGAVVGSQPFGGEGLSGTGPKAGGPNYLRRFRKPAGDLEVTVGKAPSKSSKASLLIERPALQAALSGLTAGAWASRADRLTRLRKAAASFEGPLAAAAEQALDAAAKLSLLPEALPGPTGENNLLSLHPRGLILCLGAEEESDGATALAQALQALALGNAALLACPGAERIADVLAAAGAPVAALEGVVPAQVLGEIEGADAIAFKAGPDGLRPYRQALAARPGEIVTLVTQAISPWSYFVERALCVDTTAAGGNAQLLASADKGQAQAA
ncbi:bifunctional proline dehydrogenase/L-glutamate gamma-semialdehyde dehydrogenase PutA [Limibacillus halophilus]